MSEVVAAPLLEEESVVFLASLTSSCPDDLRRNPATYLAVLVEAAMKAVDDKVAADLLAEGSRFAYDKRDVFFRVVNHTEISVMKGGLMKVMTGTGLALARRLATARFVGTLATSLPGGWPEVWLQIITTLSDASSDPDVCLGLLKVVDVSCLFAARANLRTALAGLLTGVIACATRTEHEAVSTAACNSLVNLIISSHPGDDALITQSHAVPTLLHVVSFGDGASCDAALAALLQFYFFRSSIVVQHISTVRKTLLRVLQSDEFSPTTREHAIAFFNAYFETENDLPEKPPTDFVASYAVTLFELVGRYVEPDVQWSNSYEEGAKTLKIPDVSAAASAIDVLSVALEGNIVAPLVMGYVKENVTSFDWRLRAAALILTMYSLEGCQAQYNTSSEWLLNDVIRPRMDDEHPTVRYNAIHCVSQFITDLAGTRDLRLKLVSVARALCDIATKDPIGRVRAVSVAALGSFFSQIETEDHSLFIEVAAECISYVVRCGNASKENYMRHYSLVALSAVTSVARPRLRAFNDLLVPFYMQYIDEWNSLSKEVQCHTFECASLHAAVVGAHIFGTEPMELLAAKLMLVQRELDPQDDMVPFVLRSWGNVIEASRAHVNLALPWIIAMSNISCDAEVIELRPADDVPESDGTFDVEYVSGDDGTRQVVRHNRKLVELNICASAVVTSMVRSHGDQVGEHLDAFAHVALHFFTARNVPLSVTRRGAEILTKLGNALLRQQPEQAAKAEELTCTIAEALGRVMEDWSSFEVEFATLIRMLASLARPSTLSPSICRFAFRQIRHQLICLGCVSSEQLFGINDHGDEAQEDLSDAMMQKTIAVLDMTRPLMAQSRRFADEYVAKVLPSVGLLTEITRSPKHHYIGLRLLQLLVDGLPDVVPLHLNRIAETAVYSLTHHGGYDPLLQCAFYLCGCIARFIRAAVAMPDSDPSALSFAQTVLAAAADVMRAGSDDEAAGVDACLAAAISVLQIADALPAVMTADPDATIRLLTSAASVCESSASEPFLALTEDSPVGRLLPPALRAKFAPLR